MRIGLDLDGTLISCRQKQTALMKALIIAHDKKVNLDRFWSYKRAGLNNIQALELCDIDKSFAETLNKQWVEQIESMQWMSLDSVFQEAIYFLEKIYSNKNSLHLISARNFKKISFLQLRTLNLEKYFESVDYVSECLGENKKNKMLQRKIDVYIGDTEQDYNMAVSAGVKPILVSSGMRDENFLEYYSSNVFKSLVDIKLED